MQGLIARVPTREAGLALLAGLLALVFGWSPLETSPASTLDPSWGGGLHVAIQQGKDFGTDVLFTYGPLGFLKEPNWWGTTTGAVAILYTVVVRLAMLTVVFAIARRSFGWPLAALLVLLIAAIGADPVPPLAFALALWIVLLGDGDGDGVARRAPVLILLGGLGAFGAVEVLAKTSTGVMVLASGAIAALFVPRGIDRRHAVGVFAGAAVLTGLVMWLGTGQSIGALPDYVTGSREIVSGYAAAMERTNPALAWHFTIVLLVVVGATAALWSMTSTLGRRARAGAVLLWLVLVWLSFKQGFVRHDLNDSHAMSFFSAMLIALAAIPWQRGLRLFALGLIVLPLITVSAILNLTMGVLIQPLERADLAWTELSPLASGSERAELVRKGDVRVRGETGVDIPTLRLLEGRTVHVWPSETSIIAGYDLRWHPLPTFQNYQAYTAELDDRNAEELLADDRPERVLVGRGEVIDGRIPAWDPPRSVRTLLCNYRPLGPTDLRWLVLEPGPDRCGAERPLRTVRARWGETVPVPAPSAPDRMVVLRLDGVEVGGLEKLRDLAYKPLERFIRVNGSEQPNRLIAETAENGLMLSIPRNLDLPGERALLTDTIRTLEITREGGNPGGRDLRYEFSEIEVRG